MLLSIPVWNQYFRLISALMGKKPSTPGGRGKNGSPPPDIPQRMNRKNSIPIQRHRSTNAGLDDRTLEL